MIHDLLEIENRILAIEERLGVIEVGPVHDDAPVVDAECRSVRFKGRMCSLRGSPVLYRIAELLFRRPGAMVPTSRLIETAWGDDPSFIEPNAVAQSLFRLRNRLRNAGMSSLANDITHGPDGIFYEPEQEVIPT